MIRFISKVENNSILCQRPSGCASVWPSIRSAQIICWKHQGEGEKRFAKIALRALQMLHLLCRWFLLLTDGQRMLINLHLSSDYHLVWSWCAARSTTTPPRTVQKVPAAASEASGSFCHVSSRPLINDVRWLQRDRPPIHHCLSAGCFRSKTSQF